jgi:hypothetical protein
MEKLTHFLSPPESAKFSNNYFASLTFNNVIDLDYPPIAPRGALISYVFNTEVLANSASTIIVPGEIILHIDDVLKLLREVPTAFTNGKRSVQVTLSFNSVHENRSYHFSKVCPLFYSVNFVLLISLHPGPVVEPF